ncbi:MAG TPA: glycosyltransferase family 2 protein [Methylibium sp.]|uniref:glycosyltransferase family 2 protein n=1 Tax=Methylibium sp. TaxID=2067992 RepID=UPI002DBFA968|nr:glycosyltransferase family 2 protein [Methylibium sp.]HEU4458438.1 glycosyltransferase family 2 protein [Methylibium sp.]
MSTAKPPLISIVMPTMNSAAVLAAALESLARQSFRGFELLLCDGVSRDATLAIAEGFSMRLPALSIESRRDSGVYDAINHGVRRARGRWFLVLGSDDRLHADDTLARAAEALEAERDAAVVYGDVRAMADGPVGARGSRYTGALTTAGLLGRNLCQQSVFYRRELFDELGGFDLRFRLYADWDFNLRAALAHPMRWIDLVVADYAATGMSAGAVDERFLAEMPERIRLELHRRAARPETWPLQRRLLSWANHHRKRGEWRACLSFVGSYLGLLLQRRPAPGRGS